ncbi:hypothetical protein HYZ78_03040 [Candidatus Microgenomates bacterium]|nr:hypothetical protein [Candidatus Microgenomates bacterium]
MPIKEGGHFSPEIWSLVGNPLPENLIETYMRYVNSLPPHERKVVLRTPNPNDGHVNIGIADLRANLTERTPDGLYTALMIYGDTFGEMTPQERSEVLEKPQILTEATIQRLEKAISENLKLTILDPSASHYF